MPTLSSLTPLSITSIYHLEYLRGLLLSLHPSCRCASQFHLFHLPIPFISLPSFLFLSIPILTFLSLPAFPFLSFPVFPFLSSPQVPCTCTQAASWARGRARTVRTWSISKPWRPPRFQISRQSIQYCHILIHTPPCSLTPSFLPSSHSSGDRILLHTLTSTVRM